MTTFADGVYQFGGMPVGNSFGVSKIFSTPIKGRAWFVDTSYGGNGTGKSPKTAFNTMAQAFSVLQSGDAIYFVGKVTEQLVTPVQVFDVTVVGCGNRPRHADSTPAGGSNAASQWGPPASGGTAAQATVRVLQQGWRFVNILFTMIDANAAGVEFVRNADAGDAERDASHGEVINCRFAGAGVGVRFGTTSFTENLFDCKVSGCLFNDNTTAIKIGAAGGSYRTHIDHNVFESNTNHIVGAFNESYIHDNILGKVTTAGIVLTGGANNMVNYNALIGTYANGTLYAPGTSDNWNGNAASTGFTAAVPV